MTSRKTIMVDSPVWDKTDRFKHRICVRSIGEAITEAIDIATSKEYYAGVHQFDDGHFRVESVGRTEGEAIRNLIHLYEYLEEAAPQERDIYVSSEVPENRECFYTCLCEPVIYQDYIQILEADKWESDEDIIDIPLYLTTNADGDKVLVIPAVIGRYNHEVVIVDKRTNAILSHGISYIDAWANFIEEDRKKAISDLNNLITCSASNRLFAEALKYGEDSYGNLFCNLLPRVEGKTNYFYAETADKNQFWAVVEIGGNFDLIHGVGTTGNEAIDNSSCETEMSDDPEIPPMPLESWDARNFNEWIHVPLKQEDFIHIKLWETSTKLMEPISKNPFILIRCTKELYRQAIASDEIKKGIKCRILGEIGSRTADIWKEE